MKCTCDWIAFVFWVLIFVVYLLWIWFAAERQRSGGLDVSHQLPLLCSSVFCVFMGVACLQRTSNFISGHWLDYCVSICSQTHTDRHGKRNYPPTSAHATFTTEFFMLISVTISMLLVIIIHGNSSYGRHELKVTTRAALQDGEQINKCF